MTFRRLAVSAAILLAVTYMKISLPAFQEEVVPAMHEILELDQFAVSLPERWIAWADLN